MCIDCIDMIRFLFFSSRRRHTRCALVTGVQTCALPICKAPRLVVPDEALASDMRWMLSAVSALSRALIDNWIERVLRSMFTIMVSMLSPAFSTVLASSTRRSEEHTSELQSLMRISYAVFCLKKKNQATQQHLKRVWI